MKLIILDRDGVINYDSPDYIKSPDEWHAIPGSLQAIADLHRAGYTITIATNQSGIARGLYDHETLHAIHEKMQNVVHAAGGHIDSIFYCPHHPEENCECRKPGTGLLDQISACYHMPLKGVPFVGDRISDLTLAKKVFAQPIFVRSAYDVPILGPEFSDVPCFDDLAQYVDQLLKCITL